MPLSDLKRNTCFLTFYIAKNAFKSKGITEIVLLDNVHLTALKINKAVET